jgi:hypothetical protein
MDRDEKGLVKSVSIHSLYPTDKVPPIYKNPKLITRVRFEWGEDGSKKETVVNQQYLTVSTELPVPLPSTPMYGVHT